MKKRSYRLADSVRAAFQRSGLSVKKWAETAGVPYASAHAFAAGTRDPQVSTLERLARALGLRLVAVERRKTKRK